MLILSNPSQEELVRVVHTHRNEFFKSIWNAFNAQEIRKEYFSFYITGIQVDMLNAIIYSCNNRDLITKIDEIRSFATERQIPFRFHIEPDSYAEKLIEVLTKKGFKFLTHPGMVLELKKLERTELNSENRRIVKVESKKELDLVTEVIVKVYAPNKEIGKFWKKHAITALENPKHELYLALLNEEPAGVAEVAYYNGVAGLYTIGTIAEARGKGIGTTVTKAPLFDAKELGYEWAILHASEMGYNVYKRIGFQEIGSYTIARWIPE